MMETPTNELRWKAVYIENEDAPCVIKRFYDVETCYKLQQKWEIRKDVVSKPKYEWRDVPISYE